MKERRRIHETYLANLIAESYTTSLCKWSAFIGINCYAFARRLTYSDTNHQYYTPGMIYNLKYGTGDFVEQEIDPDFIDDCINRDSIALNQPCTRVSFSEIDEDDEFYYFGIAKFHLRPLKSTNPLLQKYLDETMMTESWHFICRTPSGLWLHKPNWIQPFEIINWETYGKNFYFFSFNKIFNNMFPVECTCFENYFYRVENNYDLH